MRFTTRWWLAALGVVAVIVAALFLINCGSSGGGDPAPIAPADQIEYWNLRYVKEGCQPADFPTCYDAGVDVNLANADGNADYMLLMGVENSGKNVTTVSIRIYSGQQLLDEIDAPITFPAGQDVFVEIFFLLMARQVDCGSYTFRIWVNFADGGSTPSIEIPITVAFDCVVSPVMSLQTYYGTVWDSGGAEGR